MDSVGVITLLLTNMILDLNLAESMRSDDQDTVDIQGYVRQPVLRKFVWTDLNGKSMARIGRQHTPTTSSDSVESGDDDNGNIKQKAVYWIPTICDPLTERGYTCIGCGEALHCLVNGFALKAVCNGRRPFCNNGVCSQTRGEKCNKESDEPSNSTANNLPPGQ